MGKVVARRDFGLGVKFLEMVQIDWMSYLFPIQVSEHGGIAG